MAHVICRLKPQAHLILHVWSCGGVASARDPSSLIHSFVELVPEPQKYVELWPFWLFFVLLVLVHYFTWLLGFKYAPPKRVLLYWCI